MAHEAWKVMVKDILNRVLSAAPVECYTHHVTIEPMERESTEQQNVILMYSMPETLLAGKSIHA